MLSIYLKKNCKRARCIFLCAAGAARALHFSAAAGANAVRRAKPGDGRVTNQFFARGAFGACWRCSENHGNSSYSLWNLEFGARCIKSNRKSSKQRNYRCRCSTHVPQEWRTGAARHRRCGRAGSAAGVVHHRRWCRPGLVASVAGEAHGQAVGEQ